MSAEKEKRKNTGKLNATLAFIQRTRPEYFQELQRTLKYLRAQGTLEKTEEAEKLIEDLSFIYTVALLFVFLGILVPAAVDLSLRVLYLNIKISTKWTAIDAQAFAASLVGVIASSIGIKLEMDLIKAGLQRHKKINQLLRVTREKIDEETLNEDFEVPKRLQDEVEDIVDASIQEILAQGNGSVLEINRLNSPTD